MSAYLLWLMLVLLVVFALTVGLLVIGALVRNWRRQLRPPRRRGTERGLPVDAWLLARDRLTGPAVMGSVPPIPPRRRRRPPQTRDGDGETDAGADDGDSGGPSEGLG